MVTIIGEGNNKTVYLKPKEWATFIIIEDTKDLGGSTKEMAKSLSKFTSPQRRAGLQAYNLQKRGATVVKGEPYISHDSYSYGTTLADSGYEYS